MFGRVSSSVRATLDGWRQHMQYNSGPGNFRGWEGLLEIVNTAIVKAFEDAERQVETMLMPDRNAKLETGVLILRRGDGTFSIQGVRAISDNKMIGVTSDQLPRAVEAMLAAETADSLQAS